jgi:hypothetical protein
VFKNRVLRRVFGPARDEMTGGWRKLHIVLHNLYFSPVMIKGVCDHAYLKWILRKLFGSVLIRFIWFSTEAGERLL